MVTHLFGQRHFSDPLEFDEAGVARNRCISPGHDGLCESLGGAKGSEGQRRRIAGHPGEVKGQGVETIRIRGLLRQLILGRLDRTDDPSHSASLHGFLELLKILDCLSLINKGGTVDGANLHERITGYLQLFAASYGPEEMVPKFHYSLHLSAQLEQHGLLISCFTHERKHKSLEVWANQLCNAQSASS